MKEIFKINSVQVYNIWRNTAYGLIVVALTLLASSLLPTFLAPIVSSVAAFSIYLLTYNETSRRQNCLKHPSVVLISLITYTFLLLVLNMASLWIDNFELWFELSFFTSPYVPILLLAPTITFTALYMRLKGDNSSVCIDCRMVYGHYMQRGQIGVLMHSEAKKQLDNLIKVFGFLTLTSCLYYFLVYNPTNFTSRDSFVFLWFPVVVIIFDIFYFAIRYYNVFLDLQQQNLVVSPQELSAMQTKTWVRFYVICEDSIFLNMHARDDLHEDDKHDVIETPFIVSRESEGISEKEATAIIHSLTGVRDGKLRFFYGRRSADNFKHNIIRFFYFLPGEVAQYPHLKDVAGTWISSNKFKTLHFTNPNLHLSPLLRTDMNRLATIIVTSKTFNEKGERRTKLKQYHPSFNFEELHNSKLDFQDNAWMRVAAFNSNIPNFRLKRFWRNLFRHRNVTVDE